MMKILLVSAAAVIGTAGFAGAQTATHHMMMKKKKVLANGRCNGVSYGTGSRRCGTASGGPVGGNSSRN